MAVSYPGVGGGSADDADDPEEVRAFSSAAFFFAAADPPIQSGISSTKQRGKLERLLHRDGFDTIGDFHDMSNANIQVYLNKGIPHLNVLKLVEYIHEVWEAHAQEKVADLEPPPTPKAGGASSGDMFSNEVEDTHTNERGSIMTHNEREEAARPTPMRCNSSALRREIAKAELKKELASEMMGELTDALWDMGVRKSRQLAHLDWEDVSNKGITRFQFKVLQHIGREHSAPSSDGLTPPGSSGSSTSPPLKSWFDTPLGEWRGRGRFGA